jgi:hypothetical protein
MWELGLDPDQISEDAYLKARRRYVAGNVTSLARMIKLARKYRAERDAWEEYLGELVRSGASSP